MNIIALRTSDPAGTKLTVNIGCRYTGRRELTYDSLTGLFAESLPELVGDMEVLQRALLTKVKVNGGARRTARRKF